MVATEQLLAKDGAQFHAWTEPSGYNQVVLSMEVRLGDKKTSLRGLRTHPINARDLAARLAKEAGFDTVVWDG
jgi:hypothetical protein